MLRLKRLSPHFKSCHAILSESREHTHVARSDHDSDEVELLINQVTYQINCCKHTDTTFHLISSTALLSAPSPFKRTMTHTERLSSTLCGSA